MNATFYKLPRTRQRHRGGLTLVELVVVLVILVALASMIIPHADTAAEQARIDATNETLRRLRDVIVNNYMPDTKGAAYSGTTFAAVAGDGTVNYDGLPRMGSLKMPPQISALFLAPGLQQYNTTTHFGWHGPYLTSGTAVFPGGNPTTAAARGFLSGTSTTSAFGTAASGTYPGDPTVLDAWGNPVVMVPIQDTSYGQYYYALISAGPTGVLGTSVAAYGATAASSFTSTQYGSAGSSTGAIWAVATPISATVTVDTTGLNNNAPTGARVLTISAAEYYPYWIPLQ